MPGDWAVTEKLEGTHPDFTAIAPFGWDPRGEVWIENGYHEQATVDRSIAACFALANKHKARHGFMESGVIKNAISGMFEKANQANLRDHKLYMTMDYLPTTKDKTAMCASFRGLVAAGKVHVVDGAFGELFLAECCAFPYSTRDDLVDMAGLFARGMDSLHAHKRDKDEVKKKYMPPPKMSLPARAVEGYAAEDRAAARKRAHFRG